MQIKKDEVKNAIIQVGLKEFLDKGYEKASIRQIVKKAGTTIGNFYNYFKNKEALFDEIVGEEYNLFIYFINNHDKVERPDYLWNEKDPAIWRIVLGKLIDQMIPHFGDGLLLILNSSQGTKYESSKQHLIDIVKNHFIEHLEKLNNHDISYDFAEIIAIQLVEGLVVVMKKSKDPESRRENLMNYILFYMIGTMGIIGGM